MQEQDDEPEKTERLQQRIDRPGVPGIAQHAQKVLSH